MRASDPSLKFHRKYILTLMGRENEALMRLKAVGYGLNPEYDTSFAARQMLQVQAITDDHQTLSVDHRQQVIEAQADRERLQAEARTAIAQFRAASQFLEHVREIIRSDERRWGWRFSYYRFR